MEFHIEKTSTMEAQLMYVLQVSLTMLVRGVTCAVTSLNADKKVNAPASFKTTRILATETILHPAVGALSRLQSSQILHPTSIAMVTLRLKGSKTRKTSKIAQTGEQNSLWIPLTRVMWVILFSNLRSPHQGEELTSLSYHPNQLESIIN